MYFVFSKHRNIFFKCLGFWRIRAFESRDFSVAVANRKILTKFQKANKRYSDKFAKKACDLYAVSMNKAVAPPPKTDVVDLNNFVDYKHDT